MKKNSADIKSIIQNSFGSGKTVGFDDKVMTFFNTDGSPDVTT